jgi:hypothetical protein
MSYFSSPASTQTELDFFPHFSSKFQNFSEKLLSEFQNNPSLNEFRAKNYFPSVTRRCRPVVGRNLYRRYLSRLKGYRFEIWATLRRLGWIDAPHTQIFEISRANSGVKKIKILSNRINIYKRCDES